MRDLSLSSQVARSILCTSLARSGLYTCTVLPSLMHSSIASVSLQEEKKVHPYSSGIHWAFYSHVRSVCSLFAVSCSSLQEMLSPALQQPAGNNQPRYTAQPQISCCFLHKPRKA